MDEEADLALLVSLHAITGPDIVLGPAPAEDKCSESTYDQSVASSVDLYTEDCVLTQSV